jgi:hypothetical protein
MMMREEESRQLVNGNETASTYSVVLPAFINQRISGINSCALA